MNTVPNMISTKDLAYLEDMFNWHFNASKKANHFALEAKEEDVKKALMDAALMHANAAREIVHILKGGQNAE